MENPPMLLSSVNHLFWLGPSIYTMANCNRHNQRVECTRKEERLQETRVEKKAFENSTWWLISLGKWVITPIISGLSLLIPFITGVISHLLSGMCHQAERNTDVKREKRCNETAMSWQRDAERKGCQERTYDGPMDKTKIGLRYADKKERSRKEMKKSRGFKGKWCHRT